MAIRTVSSVSSGGQTHPVFIIRMVSDRRKTPFNHPGIFNSRTLSTVTFTHSVDHKTRNAREPFDKSVPKKLFNSYNAPPTHTYFTQLFSHVHTHSNVHVHTLTHIRTHKRALNDENVFIRNLLYAINNTQNYVRVRAPGLYPEFL